MHIHFTSSPEIITKILDLQRINLRKNLSPDDITTQGFVYVEHEPGTLQQICNSEPAVVALDGYDLAGYAICMNKTQGGQVPELVHFFRNLDSLSYQGIPLDRSTYMVCGQICIAKPYRGQNLMGRLYQCMSSHQSNYRFCITEISSLNQRSLKAHQKVGFVPIHEYLSAQGEFWQIVVWDWTIPG